MRQRPAATPLADAGRWDPWGPVLNDLDVRLVAAESGDLAALDGWQLPEPRTQPVAPEDLTRATRILDRQRALLARLRSEQAEVVAAMSSMRRPAYRAFTASPVYVDRLV